MRLRLRTRRTALFLAMFVLAMLVFLPMGLVLRWIGLDTQGFTARRASGTIWSGTLTEARFGDVELGTLRAGLSPLPLLAGRARIDLRSRDGDPEPRLAGAFTVSRNAVGLDDASGPIPVGQAFAPLPVTALDLSDVSVRFVDGACESAEGRVRATLAAGALPLPGSLSGSARCAGGALVLPLAGAAGEGATLSVWQDGRYRAELSLPAGDPRNAAALQAAGFIDAGQGWRLSAEGRF
jgi:general secretion pathway protein N